MTSCTTCGSQLKPDTRFCTRCGHALPPPSAPTPRPPAAPAPAPAPRPAPRPAADPAPAPATVPAPERPRRGSRRAARVAGIVAGCGLAIAFGLVLGSRPFRGGDREGARAALRSAGPALAAGDLRVALDGLTRALELDPGCYAACATRGLARALLRDPDGALQDLTRALALAPAPGDPPPDRLRRLQVALLLRTGRLDEAERTLARLEAGPEAMTATQVLRGQFQLLKGDAAAAERTLAAAHTADPAELGRARERFDRSLAGNDLAQAQLECATAEAMDPASPAGHDARGRLAAAQGRRAEAKAAFERLQQAGAGGAWARRAQVALADLEHGPVPLVPEEAILPASLAPFGPLALPRYTGSALVGPEVVSLAIEEGVRLEVPAGAFPKPLRLRIAVVDLPLSLVVPEGYDARAFVLATTEELPALGFPLVLELPTPTGEATVVELVGRECRPVALPEGPTSRIEVAHLSTRTFVQKGLLLPRPGAHDFARSAPAFVDSPLVALQRSRGASWSRRATSPPPGVLDAARTPDAARFYGLGEQPPRVGADACAEISALLASWSGRPAVWSLPHDAPAADASPAAAVGGELHDLLTAPDAPSCRPPNGFARLAQAARDRIRRQVEDAAPHSLTPAAFLDLCIRAQEPPNVPLGFLAAHDFLKELTWRGRVLAPTDPDLGPLARQMEKFHAWRNPAALPAGAGDKGGPLYHLFAVGTLALVGNAAFGVSPTAYDWLLANFGETVADATGTDADRCAADRCGLECGLAALRYANGRAAPAPLQAPTPAPVPAGPRLSDATPGRHPEPFDSASGLAQGRLPLGAAGSPPVALPGPVLPGPTPPSPAVPGPAPAPPSAGPGAPAEAVATDPSLRQPSPWESPQVQAAIDEWLRSSSPRDQRGHAWHWTEWGQAADARSRRLVEPPDPGAKSRYQFLWSLAPRLRSVGHGTLRGYVERRVRGLPGADPVAAAVERALRAGEEALARADCREALACFDQALRHDPRSALAWEKRAKTSQWCGIAAIAEGRDAHASFAQAESDLSRALELEPDDAPRYVERGRLRAALGDEAGAASDYRRALELDPDAADAWRGLRSLQEKPGEEAHGNAVPGTLLPAKNGRGPHRSSARARER